MSYQFCGEKMKAFVLENSKMPPNLVNKPSLKMVSGSAKVRLHAAAWNRRDYWIIQGKYPGITLPVTLGSDGCGFVLECDENPDIIGQEVIICPTLNWGDDPLHQGPDFHILGMPKDGTFAQEIIIPIGNLFPKPSHLSVEEAAALPLAGLTAWRAISSRAKLQTNERVLITGIGGGTAIFALQFARAMNTEVYVTSSSEEKLKQATNLGAVGGVLYTQENWSYKLKQKVPEGFDVIIDSAGGEGFGELVKLLGMGGRVVFFGGTRGRWPSILPQYLFFKQVSLLASTMGSPLEFREMCQFISTHNIHPIVDSIYPLKDAHESMQRLLHHDRFGKVVLQID
jgi:zinc-binding alcohol dehydrogenase/oxidoreductase